MRLDVYLSEKGIYKSRTRAQEAVKVGCVSVGGKTVNKPSLEIGEADFEKIVCLPDPLGYVGRGALKLEYAFERFEIDVSGLRCIDIGASTGGFTQVMLMHGAAEVTAVDVGRGQLDASLVLDPRVVNLENTDVRSLTSPEPFDFLSMDVSFISVTLLKEKAAELLRRGGNAVILFKPQFEVGRRFVGKGGIVKSREAAEGAMDRAISAFVSCGFKLLGKDVSPVKGGDGNTEYLLYFRKAF
ncbi:MAG: TlyA family RNA methyltransferase [Clostridia bacterium]|nr:TlyA family RNA methyltransferase [Clostridia bacterium]